MENQRRITEEVQRKDRFDDIKNEAKYSGIHGPWNNVCSEHFNADNPEGK